MNKKLIVCLIIIAILLLLIIVGDYLRIQDRKNKFKEAQERALKTGKKLIVIGDPFNGGYNSLFGPSYDCGDICIDLTGCPYCNNFTIKGKVEDILPFFNDNSYVIFISCVLEYIENDKIDFVIKELERVSGGDLYVVNIKWWCPVNYFYIGGFYTGEEGTKRIIYVNKENNITYNSKSLGYLMIILAISLLFIYLIV